MTEKELILLFKEGDHCAFTNIYDLYWKRVFNFCRLHVRTDIAEEILQDVFIKLWTNRTLVDVDKNLGGYLFVITRNLIYDVYWKNVDESYRTMSLVVALEQSYDDTEDEICAADLCSYIDRLIEELPPQSKLIFNLSRKDNLTNQEISERLNISIKAVEAGITRALKYLRQNVYTLFLSLLLADFTIGNM